MLFRSDEPITSKNEDILGRTRFSDELGRALSTWKEEKSLVVALYGRWGSGKSSILNLVKEHIKESQEKKNPTMVYTASTAPPAGTGPETPSTSSNREPLTGNNTPWDGVARGPEGPWGWTNNIFQWITCACIVVLLGGLYVFIYRRS